VSYNHHIQKAYFTKGGTMTTKQAQWATQLREVPIVFQQALRKDDDQAIRQRPAAGEWSAIEVVGHMIDKMYHWSNRVERVLQEDRPALPGYDQDAEVREHDYQHADPAVLYERLQQQCERFAALVASLPSSALQREGIHGEYGPLTLAQCIEAPLGSVSEHLAQLRAAQE
jgi:uncharacterized damage-inducible protein DinB